uniref:Uncharacterized protein n=1 Tax=Arundo donax TaxID=35708 RepID=A0A0A9BN53_ARUDO
MQQQIHNSIDSTKELFDKKRTCSHFRRLGNKFKTTD